MSESIQRLIKNSKNPKFIEDVFEFAKESYQSAKWLSGENYLEHATRTAVILHDMGVDQKTIAAAFLYNTINTQDPSEQKERLEKIEEKFGDDVAILAEKSSTLNKIYYSIAIDVRQEKVPTEEKIENIRRMFLAIAGDIRVILIKLAARIDGMNSLEKLPKEMQDIYATETLQLFVPIANRLGLGEIKVKLEDLSFAHLHPEKFKWIQEHIKKEYNERREYLKKFIPHLKRILHDEKIKFLDINYRAKSYWSTYQKLIVHDMNFEKINDLVALRVIMQNVADCYKTLGIIHKYFKPISGEINDYIARPKPNGYKSLHTTVFLEKDIVSEIQIRTNEMNKEAEYGVCAHWSYKEKVNLKKEGAKFNWTKEIPDFWKTLKINFFENQIFAFTPKGDVINLPKGSTAVDFAYAVHSEVGNHCESAKIGGKIIPLSQPLNNGDVIEIVTNRKRLPSQDWLKFVKTNFAKNHIKKLTTENVRSSFFSIPSYIKNKIVEISKKASTYRQERKRKKEEKTKIIKAKPRQLYLAGQKGMMINVAKCCLPKPGDSSKAYLTRHRAAVIHKISCPNLLRLSQKFPEKIVEATWEES